MELRCSTFHISPLEVFEVSSSFFDDPDLFPAGTISFDSAFLMRRIDHTWHGRGSVRAAASAGAGA
jgi:hypothetical protein